MVRRMLPNPMLGKLKKENVSPDKGRLSFKPETRLLPHPSLLVN
jgi:hypothetical protein